MHAAGAQLFNDFTVMRLGKKIHNALRHHRTDIRDLLQALAIRFDQPVQTAQMRGQFFRRRFADIADAERIDKSGQCGVFAFLNRTQNIPG